MNVVDILQATPARAAQRSFDFLPQAQSALKTGNVVVCFGFSARFLEHQ